MTLRESVAETLRSTYLDHRAAESFTSWLHLPAYRREKWLVMADAAISAVRAWEPSR